MLERRHALEPGVVAQQRINGTLHALEIVAAVREWEVPTLVASEFVARDVGNVPVFSLARWRRWALARAPLAPAAHRGASGGSTACLHRNTRARATERHKRPRPVPLPDNRTPLPARGQRRPEGRPAPQGPRSLYPRACTRRSPSQNIYNRVSACLLPQGLTRPGTGLVTCGTWPTSHSAHPGRWTNPGPTCAFPAENGPAAHSRVSSPA